MNPNHTEALGHLLAYYESDLRYFLNFKRFKDGAIGIDDYLSGTDHSFSNFLAEYRVARSIPANGKKVFLLKLMEWLAKNPAATDVDSLAEYIKPVVTRKKIMTSLCSKVLMLNAPHLITPIDAFTRKALQEKTNRYYNYNQKVREFRTANKPVLNELFGRVQDYLTTIEAPFADKLTDIKDVRELRLIDKLLWCIGRKS